MSKVSYITCHVSHNTCSMCHVSPVFNRPDVAGAVLQTPELVSGGSVINGAYPDQFFFYKVVYLVGRGSVINSSV